LATEAPQAELKSSIKVWRWVVWFAFLLAWSAALLAPQSVLLAFLGGNGDDAKPVHVRILDSFLFAKGLHVSAYALAAILSGWLRVAGRWRWALLAFLSAHAFGTEFFQQFVPGRHGSLRDVGLDHLGLLIGVALSWRWWRGS
jgi:hypothetical protein